MSYVSCTANGCAGKVDCSSDFVIDAKPFWYIPSQVANLGSSIKNGADSASYAYSNKSGHTSKYSLEGLLSDNGFCIL